MFKPLLAPLTDVHAVVRLIADVTATPQAEVHRRLLNECEEIGTNVLEGLKQRQISHFVTSDALDEFYKESDAFLYETTVWNTCQAKQQMRDFISSRLKHIGKENASVFCFGDGLGFDSAWLASQGHQVSYFEPSLRCQQYARHVFQGNGVEVSQLESLDEVAPGSLDVIVCLDVLEHVPEPQELVKTFAKWLKPDGVMFVHAPFWAIHWTRPTHLKQNQYLTGDLRSLYQAQGFIARDSSLFWDPVLLQKSDAARLPTLPNASLRLRLGQILLKTGRFNPFVHMWIARKIARAPQTWVKSLQEAEFPNG